MQPRMWLNVTQHNPVWIMWVEWINVIPDRIPQIHFLYHNIYYLNEVEKAVDGYKVQFSTYMIQL